MTNYDVLQLKSENFSDRGADARIVGIIAHCMGLSLRKSIEVLTKKEYEVSSHYFVPAVTGAELKQLLPDLFGNAILAHPEKIPVIQLVADKDKAWQAGVSTFANWNGLPGCEKGLNACTIGIEFHSEGYGGPDENDLYCFKGYTQAQADVGLALIQDLMYRHNIPQQNLLAHSTIAPMRKTDPGPFFFWQQLFDSDIGYLPPKPPHSHEFKSGNISLTGLAGVQVQYRGVYDIQGVQDKLQAIGFDCHLSGALDTQTRQCISAYCLQFAHTLWQPEILTGQYISDMGALGFEAISEVHGVWQMDGFLSSLNSFDAGIFYV